jgi:hypothetical protein
VPDGIRRDRRGYVPPLACESEGYGRSFTDQHYIERIAWSFAITTKNTAR